MLQNLTTSIDATFEAVEPTKLLLAGESSLSYGALKDRVERLHALFKHFGLRTGDRVVIVSTDDNSVISLYFAAIRAGLVAVVGNGETTAEEVTRLLAAAEPSLVFIDRSIMPIKALDGALPAGARAFAIDDEARHRKHNLFAKLGLQNRTISQRDTDGNGFPALLESFEPALAIPEVPDEAVAHMLFTSGTTSHPKGVEITHGNIHAQMLTFQSVYGYDPESRILNLLPLHHTDGLIQGPVIAFLSRATVYRPRPFRIPDLPDIMASVRRNRITHFIVVPTLLSLMMRLDREYDESFSGSDLKVLRSSADLLDPTLWRSFEERFGMEVTNSYGLTETVCEAIYCGPSPATKRIGTIGKPIDCKARIVDSSGNDVAPGEVGELWISGTNIMKGYFRQPEETAAVLTDGWYHTGDIARMDPDGLFAIVGRKKSVIIKGGINLHPENITSTIRTLEGVVDAVTFGLEHDVFGEVPVSCVVIEPNSGLGVDAIFAHCRTGLPPEKLPAAVYLLDEFPRSAAGKVLLNDLRTLVAERMRARTESSSNILEQIFDLAGRAFNVPVSTLHLESTPENTNGWDSLAHISFVAALERQFNLRITASQIISLRSLADAERIVCRMHVPQRETEQRNV